MSIATSQPMGAAPIRQGGALRQRNRVMHEFKRHKEMDLTGEVYHRLRCAGFDAHMEVCLGSMEHASGWMRADIAVLVDDCVVAAIEVKREGVKLGFNTRQARAYRGLPVKCIFVNSFDDVDRVVRDVSDAVAQLEDCRG